jgi:flagellar biosynthesis protein FlgN
MTTPARAAELARALAAEQGSLRAFVDVLQEEQEALTNGDIDALPHLADRKLLCAGEVATRAQARRDCALALGVAPGRAALTSWLQQHASVADARLWKEIVTLAEAARALNETNGVLVERRMADTRSALRLLGNAAAGGLYDRDGQTHAQSHGRIYGAA